MVDHVNKIVLPYNTAFVVNPAAGGGQAGRVWPDIASRLDSSGQAYSAYFTDSPGDGTYLAAKAVKEGARLVVAVGGDGTLREVVNGIDPEISYFGVIPLGTGNGFRRTCKIPGNWNQALKGLTEWEPQQIDLGLVNGSYFLNVVGIGFDAAVAEMAAEKYSRIKGYMAYLVAFFNELIEFDYFSARVAGEDLKIEEEQALLVVVANGKYYGGTFSIAPEAEVNDGKLDLILVRKRNNPETTLLAVKALAHRHLEDNGVIFTRGTSFLIEADHSVPVHIDGEVIGTLPVDISIKHAALKVLAPEA